jgi:hypothetical protein
VIRESRAHEKSAKVVLVSIHVGDFRSFAPMVGGFVFCDSLHDLHEISFAIDPKLLAAVAQVCRLGTAFRSIGFT